MIQSVSNITLLGKILVDWEGVEGGGLHCIHSQHSYFTKIFFSSLFLPSGFFSGSCETPVRGNLTPSCQVQQSGSRSILVSPSTQPNHESNSGKKSEHKKNPGSPASGRIHKEIRETIRNLFLKKEHFVGQKN